MLILAFVSVALMAVDHLSDALDGSRGTLTVMAAPIVVLADLPGRGMGALSNVFQSRGDLQKRLLVLERERLMLRQKPKRWLP